MNKTINPEGFDASPLMTRPERVAIVALGPSINSFIRETMTDAQMGKSPFDEVWTLNRGVKGINHDKLFVMDDLKWIEKKAPAYAKYLRKYSKSKHIITTTAYDDYPNAIEYPYQEVLETIKDDIFNRNTVSYMVGYAIHIMVKETSLYGADFVYPNGVTAEEGGQAVAYLLGMMRAFELTHRIPNDSTLLYANKVRADPQTRVLQRPAYGYHRISEMKKDKEREAKVKKARLASLKEQ